MKAWNQTGELLQPNCTVDTNYRFTYYEVSYGLIFVVGLVGNGVALRRLWLFPRAATSTAVYMANLAAADLFFVASLPLRVYFYHRNRASSSDLPGDWSPGDAFCQLTFTLKYMSLYGGIFFLACIGMDRYLAVVRPSPRRPRRARAARLLSGAIWCLVLALSLALPLLRSAASPRGRCLPDPASRRHRGFILIALVLVQAAFLLPALLLLFGYCGVLRVLAGLPRHRQGRRRRRRTLAVIYSVLGVFLLCFAPYHLNLLGYTLTHLGLLPGCGLARVTKALHPVLLSLASANCCFNPVIYYFSSSLAHKEAVGSGTSGSQ